MARIDNQFDLFDNSPQTKELTVDINIFIRNSLINIYITVKSVNNKPFTKETETNNLTKVRSFYNELSKVSEHIELQNRTIIFNNSFGDPNVTEFFANISELINKVNELTVINSVKLNTNFNLCTVTVAQITFLIAYFRNILDL